MRLLNLCGVILIGLLVTQARAQDTPKKITGAFGYQFGDVIDPASPSVTGTEEMPPGSGQMTLKVNPPTPNDVFRKYSVQIDLQTHKIYAILASVNPLDGTANDLCLKLKNVLAAKYGNPVVVPAARPAFGPERVQEIRFGDQNQSLTLSYGHGTVWVTYRDDELLKEERDKSYANVTDKGL